MLTYTLSLHDALPISSPEGGLINQIIMLFGGEPIHFLGNAKYFRSVLITSEVWKAVGFGSILYLAAITTIEDRKSTRLNSSHVAISYAVFCLKKKTQK